MLVYLYLIKTLFGCDQSNQKKEGKNWIKILFYELLKLDQQLIKFRSSRGHDLSIAMQINLHHVGYITWQGHNNVSKMDQINRFYMINLKLVKKNWVQLCGKNRKIKSHKKYKKTTYSLINYNHVKKAMNSRWKWPTHWAMARPEWEQRTIIFMIQKGPTYLILEQFWLATCWGSRAIKSNPKNDIIKKSMIWIIFIP